MGVRRPSPPPPPSIPPPPPLHLTDAQEKERNNKGKTRLLVFSFIFLVEGGEKGLEEKLGIGGIF